MKLKKLLGLLLSAALACGLALPAAAEHYTGADDWNVAFTGKGMESNFRSSVFDDAMTAQRRLSAAFSARSSCWPCWRSACR